MGMVKIILPERKMDLLGSLLVDLTEEIAARDAELVAHGVLGGEFGYGADFENTVFVMRPFYWGDCDCDAPEDENHRPTCSLELPNFRHKASGFEVRWYKYIGRSMEAVGSGDLHEIFRQCRESLPPKPEGQ